MKPIVAFPFRHHSTMICPEAKQMLIDAGFELICNDTGRKLDRDEQKEMIAAQLILELQNSTSSAQTP